jgi:hypothetical protein
MHRSLYVVQNVLCAGLLDEVRHMPVGTHPIERCAIASPSTGQTFLT